MEMMDMGHKMSETCCAPAEANKQAVDYPSLHLDNKIPAGLEENEIGDIVDCHIQLKVRRIEMNNRMEAGKAKKTLSMAFDIMKIGVMDKPKENKLTKKIAGLKHGEY